MKEHPILFSSPMVRAILLGEKTQTRRIIKPQPRAVRDGLYGWKECAGGGYEVVWNTLQMSGSLALSEFCPYGQPGDHLWVRESWATRTEVYDDGVERTEVCYAATPRSGIRVPGCIRDVDQMTYLHLTTPLEHHGWGWPIKWRPSIHLPRKYSRITLEITGVRVERINDISEADMKAEGIDYVLEQAGNPLRIDYRRQAFFGLWERINGAHMERDEYGRYANVWVWVVEFKLLPSRA